MDKSKLEKICIVIFAIIIFIVMYLGVNENSQEENITVDNKISYQIENIPEYSGEIFAQINNNMPKFSEEDMNIEKDYYSNLENRKVRNGND